MLTRFKKGLNRHIDLIKKHFLDDGSKLSLEFYGG